MWMYSETITWATVIVALIAAGTWMAVTLIKNGK